MRNSSRGRDRNSLVVVVTAAETRTRRGVVVVVAGRAHAARTADRIPLEFVLDLAGYPAGVAAGCRVVVVGATGRSEPGA